MGELIHLAEHLAHRRRSVSGGRPVFFFDLACPSSYLAAERVERVLGEVDWVPVNGATLHRGTAGAPVPRARLRAERRAEELRLPLVWPEHAGQEVPGALRAAAWAAQAGAGARFSLAASRLAFCGGFDLEDPEILSEAAAAAGLAPRHCLAAAADPCWDAVLEHSARSLRARGIGELPAVGIGRRLLAGEGAVARVAPLAPAG